MFPRPSLPAGFELSPRPSLPAGRDFGPVRTCGAFPPTAARQAPHRSRSHGRLRRPKSLPIRHSPAAAQCFSPWAEGMSPGMSHADASIRKSGPEIKNRCTDCPCFDLCAAAIRKFGLEIKNRCTVCPCFGLFAASIRKSGPEIKNRCTVCHCFGLLAASIRKYGLEIKNRCTKVHGMRHKAAAIANSGPEIGNHCSAIVPASRTARLRKVVAATLLRPILIFFAAK